ncbi:MAG: DUF1738 domain-containing protein [Proteobacteria bacterium]|nr:MAG: DUF1738 domain-containing protein [Pseudomonadota bacterium]
MTQSQNEYYKNIADKLVEQLKNGTAPWQKPWQEGRSLLPYNPVSGTRYRGGNTIALMAQSIDKGFDDSRWMTYEQAKSVDAQVRKGEKGTVLRFYKFSEDVPVTDASGRPVLDESGKKLTHSMKLDSPKVISFVVFNASQIDGLKPEIIMPGRTEWEVNERAERVLKASGAKISLGGDRAYYNYQKDEIKLPSREMFKSDSGYYATALHEVGHWTGHDSRLDRDMRHPFGSTGYAKEELCAEIFSMMLGSEIGLGHDPGQHAAYVNSWIKVLQDDHREIFRAAADAEKMMGHLIDLEKSWNKKLNAELCVLVERIRNDAGTVLEETVHPGVVPRSIHEESLAHGENKVADIRDLRRGDDNKTTFEIVPIQDLSSELVRPIAEGALENQDWTYQEYKWIFEAHNIPTDDLEKQYALDVYENLYVVADRTLDMEVNQGEVISETVKAQVGSKKDLEADIKHRRIWSDYDNDTKGEYTEQRAVKISELSESLTNELALKIEKYPASFDEDHLKVIKTFLVDSKGKKEIIKVGLAGDVTAKDIDSTKDRLFLEVPYTDRKQAKALGAKWDKDQKSWYAPASVDASVFEKWQKTPNEGITSLEVSEKTSERVYIAVPYLERNEGKALGAKWDKEHKSWCVEPGGDLKLFDKWTNTKVLTSNMSPVEEFSLALKGAGLLLDGSPVMDGSLQRVQVEGGKLGNRDGAYIGHLDGRPSGYIENFKIGVKENWKAQGYTLNEADRAKLHADAAQKLEKRRKEQEEAQALVADKVSDFVGRLPKAQPDHSYFVKKGLTTGSGALISQEDKALVVPASDINGKVWSYQKISESGMKSFAPGGRIEGCMFVATPSSLSVIQGAKQKQFIENTLKSDQIFIAEGFATAATLSEALNKSVIAAFSAGNLLEVAKAVRRKAPHADIVICGDDDKATELKIGKNLGKDKALAAAEAVNGRAIFPKFAPGQNSGSDFNDLFKASDLKTVNFQIRFGTAVKNEIAPPKEIKSSVGLFI